jgi:pyruvate-ferredoxin/flavodoxin oxidoreductase
LKKGGIFLLNCQWKDSELDERLPAYLKKYLAENDIDFYTIDATDIAEDIGLGNRINMIMQSAFFKLAKVIDIDDAVKYMKKAIEKTYGAKGENIVKMNFEAVDKGISSLHKVDVPKEWVDAEDDVDIKQAQEPDFIKNVLRVMNRQEGDKIPVSAFVGSEDGSFPAGTTAYEKRGIAISIPEWQMDNCIQCNQCSFICPHAVIRPVLLDEEEVKKAPEDFKVLKAKGKGLEEYSYRIQVSPLDCTGCGNCADICPAKEKALIMKSLDSQREEIGNWEFAKDIPTKDAMSKETLKGSQFKKPLLEFSGACAGCGETPYAKLVTQLFGDRMVIANATGCSSIWGGSAPSTPYTVDEYGKGPAWANSLFEDNAEYGYGMAIAVKQMRAKIKGLLEELKEISGKDLKEPIDNWLMTMEDAEASKDASAGLLKALSSKKFDDKKAEEIKNRVVELKDYLIKKSVWVFGGDGWAYDIGYGGLDHVLASKEDINVLVFDTEVYSNTGGQSSKATPKGAVAKFAASGKKVKKKDLGLIATTYGYIYVAQIAMGANKNHTLKAILEAERYPGPSLIIAYAPCINHGIRIGMGKSQLREKQAVDSGYWHLWRFDPRMKDEGKNPFRLDSKEPKESFREFLDGEVRYSSLEKTFPEIAKELFDAAEEDAKEKYENYKKMAEN